MSRQRSLLVLTIILALVFSAVGARAQELTPGGTFVDDDGSHHESAIEALVAAGITQGCSPDRYCPDDAVTRGQMASFLARGLDGLAATDVDWFDDDAQSEHQADINLLAANAIALGYGGRLFGPEDVVTRGQMASLLVRGIPDLAAAEADWFADDEGNTHEAAINVIAHNGITVGYVDGTFRPSAPVSRAEMATLLTRALGLTPIQPPPRAREVSAYFLADSLGDDPAGLGPFLLPVARMAATPAAPATPTMQQLLAGPTAAEMAGTPSITTAIPGGTELLGLVVSNGVATVDLSAEFASGGGTLSMLGRVAQVVFTLTQFPTVDAVAFRIEGVPTSVLGGEGLMLDSYGTREGFLGTGLLPSVFVDQPAWGGVAGNPLRAVGRTAALHGEFVLTIVDADGLILVEQPVAAAGDDFWAPGGPRWISFDVTVPYTVDEPQLGALIVGTESSSDGSLIAVREYPVGLVPTD